MTQLFMTHPDLSAGFPAPTLPVGMTLRAAEASDSAAIAALLAEAFEEEWDDARVGRDLLDAADVAVTWVIADAQGLLAVASERLMPQTYPGAGYVHYVGVAARARGLGLGAVVTARCMTGFLERGLPTAVLETDDFRTPAVITYLRLGYIPTYRNPAEQKAWSGLFPVLQRSKS
ncbi:MAG: GNAT family N-acetyltransferase [Rhodoglobus sp.]